MTKYLEMNLDTLSGMTYGFSALSFGNLASMSHEAQVSNPYKTALEGLQKIHFLDSLGIKQAILPPHERPHIETLKNIGFTGNLESILSKTYKIAPWALKEVSSSAFIWTANAATITPSIDSQGSKVQITPANLSSQLHRSIETAQTAKVLKKVFQNPIFFEHHPPLISVPTFQDEGAANHCRFTESEGKPGIHLFVFGKSKQESQERAYLLKYPARQTKEASEAIARKHHLTPERVVFAEQSIEAINAGCFHNDVIGVSHLNFFMLHEKAFTYQTRVLDTLFEKFRSVSDIDLNILEVKEDDVPLKDAVSSYLFNSQIVSVPGKGMHLLAPSECLKHPSVAKFLESLLESNENPIQEIHYLEVKESMNNGGGPACLRLRVSLNEEELKEVLPAVIYTPNLHKKLIHYIEEYYPKSLTLKDLSSPSFYNRNCEALDEISKILGVGNIYSFQK